MLHPGQSSVNELCVERNGKQLMLTLTHPKLLHIIHIQQVQSYISATINKNSTKCFSLLLYKILSLPLSLHQHTHTVYTKKSKCSNSPYSSYKIALKTSLFHSLSSQKFWILSTAEWRWSTAAQFPWTHLLWLANAPLLYWCDLNPAKGNDWALLALGRRLEFFCSVLLDSPWMEYHTTESWEPRGVEEAGCKIYSDAPTVSQTKG